MKEILTQNLDQKDYISKMMGHIRYQVKQVDDNLMVGVQEPKIGGGGVPLYEEEIDR